MDFVELNRSFVPLRKDQEPSLDIGILWGRKLGGWLDWNDLRTLRRVVLLAEASSGKSEEFKNQANLLAASGKAAFCLRIEELAEHGFESALDANAVHKFSKWQASNSEGWFFLDSIDEARLNRKSFDSALKRFARELGPALERSHVFVSCRVTDWKGPEDRATMNNRLPAWETPKAKDKVGTDRDALLDPIFAKREKQAREEPDKAKHPNELIVVQLVPLSAKQYRLLAEKAGVRDVETFVAAIAQNGLESFAERPGDLLDLADYWQTHSCFGTFAEMVEHGVNRKLRELDTHRPDNEALSLDRAREGACRLAAALTLGKSFTLRAPNYDPDPTLAAGALDPATILPDWSEAQRNALLRRGVFAPATYGRIRFHHRSTQEYLTADWFNRLLAANCPRSEVWNLIFAERYGVETLVPSIRPVAAWLALKHEDFRDEIIRREPLTLLRHGDPGSLSIDVRDRLLATYAEKHAGGEISDDRVEQRALWMFADERLAPAIQRAWKANTKSDFRFDMLRLIRDGRVKRCSSIAAQVARNITSDDYHRIVAIQALKAVGDAKGLASAARSLIAAPHKATARLAPSFAEALYPAHLSASSLLKLLSRSVAPRENSTEGFGSVIGELYIAAPTRKEREKLVGGVADLCLKPPFVTDYQPVSKKHYDLAKHLYEIAIQEVRAAGLAPPTKSLVRLLMVVERAGRRSSVREDTAEDLRPLVGANTALVKALFWADIEAQRATATKEERKPVRYWQVYFGTNEGSLWAFTEDDLPWLYADFKARSLVDDKRVALSAIVHLLEKQGNLEAESANLYRLIGSTPILKEDLDGYLKPRAEDEETRRLRQRLDEGKEKREEQEEKDKASWIEFREVLRSTPSILSEPKNLVSWKAGIFRLNYLTQWLQKRAEGPDETASREWRLLEEAFGRAVAEAYRNGMKALWRVVIPRRPKRAPGGSTTIRWDTLLAFYGVGLEAVEDPDWASHLTNAEARRAAQHGCFADQGYPEWIENLINSHPSIVLPIIKNEIVAEWSSPTNERSSFLYRYGAFSSSIQLPVQKALITLISKCEAGNLFALEKGLRILRHLQLDGTQRLSLTKIGRTRFSQHEKAKREGHAIHYLAWQMLLEPDLAIRDLLAWLNRGPLPKRRAKAERTLGILFDRHDPLITGVLERASVSTLEKLLHAAYSLIRPEDDVVHAGTYSPGMRDNAESARNTILSAILDRPGADAYRVMVRAAEHPTFDQRAERFKELALGKAERDSERPAWSAAEIVNFERQHTAPIKTGADLLRIVMAVLEDIALRLREGDVTTRPLLMRANNEEEVQNWLVENMNFRARERFLAYREAEVAEGDKPDVIVASNAAHCEVAIEVKHGGKGWTARQLDTALRVQLAVDYLKPATRRHGVLVVTNHYERKWLDVSTRKPIPFEALIKWLSGSAAKLQQNQTGAIEVRCFGIDAWRRDVKSQERKSTSRRVRTKTSAARSKARARLKTVAVKERARPRPRRSK